MKRFLAGNRYHRTFWIGICAVLFALWAVYFLGNQIYEEHAVQAGFQRKYGADWKEYYEQSFGPGSLEHAHVKTILGFASMPVFVILPLLIYMQARNFHRVESAGEHPRRRKKHRSNYK